MAAYVPKVRYLINEAASGRVPTHLVDTIGGNNALINYQTDRAQFLTSSEGRGLSFDVAAATPNSAFARIQATSGNWAEDFEGTTEVSGIVAFRIDAYTEPFVIGGIIDDRGYDGSVKIMILGYDFGQISFRVTFASDGEDGSVQYRRATWFDGFPYDMGDIVVIHYVIDTTQADENDRVRIYVNGVLFTEAPSGGVGIPQNQGLRALAANDWLWLGNGAYDSNSESGDFVLYYYELGIGQFTLEQVEDTAAALILNNDTNPWASAEPPTLTEPITISDITSTSFTASSTADQNCTVSMVVVDYGAPEPQETDYDESDYTTAAVANTPWEIEYL